MIDEKAVFSAAREIGETAERERYLEDACRGEPDALRRIRQLLKVDEDAGSFLGSPAVASFESRDATPPLESAGSVIGPYRLLEQIGEGGCGVVFMAEQTQPVRRRVALKVIKPGMDTRQVIARFEAERQALALMDHPNVAKILDAGTTASGRPYFVMELVRGVPITEYCDEHRLTPRERLELFATVCHAVQHAHQKGIIHRDLKPTNVLVTQHDDRPVAKVIDFGIAKATSGQLTDKTLFTGFAQLVGTPLYMSPEQAAMSALDVDTRSDIYSLGILLYELLAGAPPFGRERLQHAGFEEIRRIIREEEPATPSTRLSTSDALPTLAANRGMEPTKLTRLIRGDLDWIVMKALEKDRGRRYETANGFAMDVQRYLADEPVLACPPSVAYRLRKFARRNKVGLAVATLTTALLLVVVGSIGWAARDRAAREGRNAEAVATLLDQAEEALRSEAADRAKMALEAAERRAADGGAEALANRLGRARADLTFLRACDDVDTFQWIPARNRFPEWKAIVARWKSAWETYGVRPDVDEPVGVAARVNESPVRERALYSLDHWLLLGGSPAGVRAVLRIADPDPFRDAFRDAWGAGDVPRATEVLARPEALAQPARFAAVLGLLLLPVARRQAVMESALRKRPGDLHLLAAMAHVHGPYLRQPGRGRDADERLRWYQALVAAHPANANAHIGVGNALLDRGQWDDALSYFQRATEIDPTLALARLNQGVAYASKGDWSRAAAASRDVLRLDPHDAAAYYNLARALEAQGDADGILACFREAVEQLPDEASVHAGLARVLLFLARGKRDATTWFANDAGPAATLDPGRRDEAIRHFEEAIRLAPAAPNPVAAEALGKLGYAFAMIGDAERTDKAYRESIRLDPTGLVANTAYHQLARDRELQGDLDGALAWYRSALQQLPDDVSLHVGLAAILLIRARGKQGEGTKNAASTATVDPGEREEGIRHFEDAIRLAPPSPDQSAAYAHGRLAYVFATMGDEERLVRAYRESIRLDPTGPLAPAAYFELARAREAQGDLDGALAYYRNAVEQLPNDGSVHAGLAAILLTRARAKENEGVLLVSKDAAGAAAATSDPSGRDEAIRHFDEAMRLRPASPNPTAVFAYSDLGYALGAIGDFEHSATAYREAIRHDPNVAQNHTSLGGALFNMGKREDAIREHREAVRLDENLALARANLASALLATGDPEGALPHVEALARLDPATGLPLLGQVRAALDPRTPRILAGEAASPDELLALAGLCAQYRRAYADAASLYERAFAAEPSRSRGPESHRYNAACAAALAAAGQGVGAETLDRPARTRLRGMAFDWLRAELAAYQEPAAGDAAAVSRVRDALRHWTGDPDLSGVRDAEALAALPEAERVRWTKLWDDVREFAVRTPTK